MPAVSTHTLAAEGNATAFRADGWYIYHHDTKPTTNVITREGVYVVVPSDIEIKPETLIKATAQVMGYHATNIHKELNGFQGYGAIHYTLISPEEAEPNKQKLGLSG